MKRLFSNFISTICTCIKTRVTSQCCGIVQLKINNNKHIKTKKNNNTTTVIYNFISRGNLINNERYSAIMPSKPNSCINLQGLSYNNIYIERTNPNTRDKADKYHELYTCVQQQSLHQYMVYIHCIASSLPGRVDNLQESTKQKYVLLICKSI